jgi:hypothetical protein
MIPCWQRSLLDLCQQGNVMTANYLKLAKMSAKVHEDFLK